MADRLGWISFGRSVIFGQLNECLNFFDIVGGYTTGPSRVSSAQNSETLLDKISTFMDGDLGKQIGVCRFTSAEVVE